MAAPLRQALDAPLGLDAPLEELLAGTTSEELRGMLVELGVKPPGTKPQRLAALVEYRSDPEQIASVVVKAPAAARKLLHRRAGATGSLSSSCSGLPAPTSNRACDGRWTGDS